MTFPLVGSGVPEGASTNDSDDKLYVLLRQLIAAARDPVWYQEATNALQVYLLGGTTAVTGTLTGVTTVGGLTNIGGVSADLVTENVMETDWGVTTRSLMI